MQTAEKVRRPPLVASDEPVDEVTSAAQAQPKVLSRSAILSLALQVAVVLGVVWLTQSMATKFEASDAMLRAEMARTEELTRQASVLAGQTSELKNEVAQLRQFMASDSAVDTIFLKTLILKPDLDRKLARKIAKYVHRYSRLYGQDPNLVISIMAVESNFDPKAESQAGALGLMQVMPQWKKVLGIKEDLRDPETSINYGLQVLGFYRNMYKDLDMSLTAYNRGPGPVDMALMRGKDPTNKYSPRVLAMYKRLKSMEVGRL